MNCLIILLHLSACHSVLLIYQPLDSRCRRSRQCAEPIPLSSPAQPAREKDLVSGAEFHAFPFLQCRLGVGSGRDASPEFFVVMSLCPTGPIKASTKSFPQPLTLDLHWSHDSCTSRSGATHVPHSRLAARRLRRVTARHTQRVARRSTAWQQEDRA